MVQEVRRQFREIPGLLAGTAQPDSARCVDISTRAALREMIVPGLTAVLAPASIPPNADRKSTRLNSSHGYISYAVFCLKKKKQQTTMPYSTHYSTCV